MAHRRRDYSSATTSAQEPQPAAKTAIKDEPNAPKERSQVEKKKKRRRRVDQTESGVNSGEVGEGHVSQRENEKNNYARRQTKIND